MSDRDLEQRIDAALDAGDLERAAELLAASRALAEEARPPVAFDAIRARLPVRKRSWFVGHWMSGLAAAACAVMLVVVAPAPTGLKGPLDVCAPVRLRVTQPDGAPLPRRTIDAGAPVRVSVVSGCPSRLFAVELGSGRWRPLDEGEVTLDAGRWALALIATRRPQAMSREDVIAVLRAAGEHRSPTVSGEPALVDVYRLEVR